MTQSIISLGQRAALSALLLRASCPEWAARPAFSVGHFDQLIPLRVKSSAGWRHLIFNDLEALQVESSAHFDHLIFTEWGVTCYRKTEVLKMITPVVLLRMKSGCHFDTAKIKFPKWEPDSAGGANQVTESVT